MVFVLSDAGLQTLHLAWIKDNHTITAMLIKAKNLIQLIEGRHNVKVNA